MEKILVVDNHPVMLQFMTNLLEKQGHEVITANDGLSALTAIRQFHPQIMFVDLVMPNIDGEKLCRIIRTMPEMKDIYIIIVSAIAADLDIDFSELGVKGVIAKGPLDQMSRNVLTALERAKLDFQGKSLQQMRVMLEKVSKREATGELIASKKHLDNLLNNMSEAIFELNYERRIVYVNNAAVVITGILEEKLLSRSFSSLFDKELEADIESFIISGSDPEKVLMGESVELTINGRNIRLHIPQIRQTEEDPLTIIMNDITERKRMENQLRQAKRMESIATLAGGIAHQFNNALSVITGNIELIKMNEIESEMNEFLGPINNSAYRMSHLTSQLLAYARGGKYNPKVISLKDFLRDTMPLIRHSIDPNIVFEVNLPEDLHHTKADLTQMQMVLSGVVSNAAEAISTQGHIRLEAFNSDIQKNHPDLKPGCYACVKIEDNGKGMDEETRIRIFEPFFTTNFQGRGLGMAAAYGIIQNHDGSISVDSKPGKGTSVCIYLPAVDPAPAEPPREKQKLEQTTGVILLIEDEKMILEICQTMLEKLGYSVLQAFDGQEAIDIVRNFEGDIDLAILDIGLPDMGGEVLYPILREARESLKVIVCSGYAIDGPAQEILDAGAQGFIQKPYAFSTLAEKLEEVLSH